MIRRVLMALTGLALASAAAAQSTATGSIGGKVTDGTGAGMPGVTVEARRSDGDVSRQTVTSLAGDYVVDGLPPGRYQVTFGLINFASVVRKDVDVAGNAVVVNAEMQLALNAEVTVVARHTFVNIADVDNPAENLVGIAQSSSQGAITGAQLDGRPLLRAGEVLETVPGMITTSHAGGGKANQYFLRGFNLDHGTDFAQSIAGIPVNMPSHAHGQGYSDINFLIPELVSGVQFSKGPYFADQGDFATAGSANTSYVTSIDRPIVHVETGSEAYGRAFAAVSPVVASGHLLAAFEAEHSDGPFDVPDRYRKLNGVVRYSRGDSVNGLAVTFMGYHGQWTSTDQVPARAVAEGLIDRFGSLDPSDGGHTYRYSLSGDWQHGTGSTLTKVTAYGIAYDLDLFSNFTFDLDDPVHGDQIEQADHRFVSGLKVMHKRQARWAGLAAQNTVGIQIRNDDITNVALYHTESRVRLETRSQAAVMETAAGVYAQNELEWTPWLRTLVGLRGDVTRFRVDALDPANTGTTSAGLVSPKGGVTLGPWGGTELYLNAGLGFHSNDARGTTATRDPDGNRVDPVTPLVRAKGAEVGVRTVAVPHLQTTLTVWTLRLDSELAFSGDTAGSEPSRPSERHGVELANYFSPFKWLTFDGDVSWSRARYTQDDPVGDFIPEAVGTVVSAGVSVDHAHRLSGSVRWRYFGPRTLIEDNSARSAATSLVNAEGGYQLSKAVRVTVSVFNLFNALADDVTYYYVSRLPGEPADGVADYVSHPTIPRSVRVGISLGH